MIGVFVCMAVVIHFMQWHIVTDVMCWDALFACSRSYEFSSCIRTLLHEWRKSLEFCEWLFSSNQHRATVVCTHYTSLPTTMYMYGAVCAPVRSHDTAADTLCSGGQIWEGLAIQTTVCLCVHHPPWLPHPSFGSHVTVVSCRWWWGPCSSAYRLLVNCQCASSMYFKGNTYTHTLSEVKLLRKCLVKWQVSLMY